MSYAVRSGSDGHGPEMVCVRVVANAVAPSQDPVYGGLWPPSPVLQTYSPSRLLMPPSCSVTVLHGQGTSRVIGFRKSFRYLFQPFACKGLLRNQNHSKEKLGRQRSRACF